MLQQLTVINAVVDNHLCTGCGACAFAAPQQIQMIDTLDHSRRPRMTNGADLAQVDETVARVCPGANYPKPPAATDDCIPSLYAGWGPVLEVWEGHATDSEIRFRGSSGGVTTALALFAVEQGGMDGVLHVRARKDAPLLNETVLSRDRDSLLAGAGSRYSPASPCERLDLITEAEGPCVFIGKPCDVAATAKARRENPALDQRLGMTVAIFCAGTPSIRGTLELAKHLGASDPSQIEEVSYRGRGWPGEMTVAWRDPESGERKTGSTSYDKGWGQILQKHREWRCHVCADHTGELADVSVGDPWYRPVQPGEPGRSLVLVRTETGRRMIREACDRGYLQLEQVPASVLPASQTHLLRSKGATWGRSLVSRFLMGAAPRYPGMPLFSVWLRSLSWREKLQSLYGTVRRVFRKKLNEPERSVPVPANCTGLANDHVRIDLGHPVGTNVVRPLSTASERAF